MRERALRRLVADLALASEDDIEAILSELGPQRARVEALLAEYAGKAAAAVPQALPPSADSDPLAELEGISPWLSARIASRQETGGEPAGSGGSAARQDRLRKFEMTPAAIDALRRSAAELRPPAPAPEPRRGRSLLGHVHGALLGRGRPA
ncbi:MAG TPA: hypothetical protein VIT45_16760 [Allosphingosinicella sp.]